MTRYLAIALSAFCIVTFDVHAQTRSIGARELILDDGAGNTITIQTPTSGWSGNMPFVLPLAPTLSGTGATGYIPVWDGAASLANSALQDDGATVSVSNGEALLLSGTTRTTPASGVGSRLMWIPAKSAFRAGYIESSEWNDANIGQYSFGSGYGTIGSGFGSTAMGVTTTASGTASTAMGSLTVAFGAFSTAIGTGCHALGDFSTAMGNGTSASGSTSTTMGFVTSASAFAATAMGQGTTASGINATAMGYSTTASGDYSTAMGLLANTNGQSGSFVYGDNSAGTDFLATATNQFDVRAAGGVNFYTMFDLSSGAQFLPGGSVLFTGTTGTTPASGVGSRLMWIPAKSAFRAGFAEGSEWNDANIGQYSSATGYSTTASGNFSTALGVSTTASGAASIAMGFSTVASGAYSTAFGAGGHASGDFSTAMGNTTTASGAASTAMGLGTSATAFATTAMGQGTTASGINATAMGYSTTASGDYSTAMGLLANTNGQSGSFVYGDNSVGFDFLATATNQFDVRAQQIWFGTDNTISFPVSSYLATSTGAYLTTGGTWTNSSDRNKKENFTDVSGEKILNLVRSLPITEWNYKADGRSIRHLGPMAQDFHAAFDLNGTDDTHITTVDEAGVALAAIKALANENAELRAELEALRQEMRSRALTSSAQNLSLPSR
jgi:hypothetical protein